MTDKQLARVARLIEADQAEELGQWERAALLRLVAWPGRKFWGGLAVPLPNGRKAFVRGHRYPEWLLVSPQKGAAWLWSARKGGWSRMKEVAEGPRECPAWVRAAAEAAASIAARTVLVEIEGQADEVDRGGSPREDG